MYPLDPLQPILDSLHSLHRKVDTLMAGTTELDTELSNLEAAQDQESTDVLAAFAALEAKIAATPVAADLQPEIDRLKALVVKEQTADAAATPLKV